MSIRKLLAYAMMCVLALTLACGGDNGTGPEDKALTPTEFSSMVEALSMLGSLGFDVTSGGAATSRLANRGLTPQSTTTITVSDDVACPAGGNSHFTGTGTLTSSETGVYVYDYTMTLTYNECKVTSSDGTTWTFNGDPNITFALDYIYSQAGPYSYTGVQTGGLRWSGAGKVGSCAINITTTIISSNPSSGTYSGSHTGTVCGQPVNQSFTS